MPFHDPQFWIVSSIAAVGLFLLARPFLPRRGRVHSGCDHCASGAAARRPKRTALTVEGRGVR
ncbi:MAG: hypothetical protein KDA22_16395 [Phycisphaerales bacterium]|nr:hypothetical protein [Phycisphaerales bacterium]